MKTLLRLTIAAALAGFAARMLLNRRMPGTDLAASARPVRDAEPSAPEPLQPQDQNVAQNAPL
jgi:hypothetical protein